MSDGDADHVRAQFEALPAEALSAMLAQHIAQTRKLQESNVEIAEWIRNANKDDAGPDDEPIDQQGLDTLQQAYDENVGVIERKKNLASTMRTVLTSKVGGSHGLSAELTRQWDELFAAGDRVQQDEQVQGVFL